jgi:hypothetical protein
MRGNNPIRDLASAGQLQGSGNAKHADPPTERQLKVIDMAEPGAPRVSTGIDAYVAGQYLGRNGKSIDVTQRYTVYVSYSARTQAQAMQQAREEVINHFQQKYGATFNVTNINIQDGPRARAAGIMGDFMGIDGEVAPGQVAPSQFYLGGEFWKSQTRYEKIRWDVGSQSSIRRANVKSIRRRYAK